MQNVKVTGPHFFVLVRHIPDDFEERILGVCTSIDEGKSLIERWVKYNGPNSGHRDEYEDVDKIIIEYSDYSKFLISIGIFNTLFAK